MRTIIQPTPCLVPSFEDLELFALAMYEKEKRRKNLAHREEDRRRYFDEDER